MKTLANGLKNMALVIKMYEQKIHYVCVPLIFSPLLGCYYVLMLSYLLATVHPAIANWAFIILLFVLLFYFRLSLKMGLQMFLLQVFALSESSYFRFVYP
jgi:uncharacterized membrane protein YGL010W